MDRLDEVGAQLYGLNRTDMRALDIIGRDGPLAPTDLARLLGFTTGGVTTVIDRLERAGYARRRPDNADRRRLVVDVTRATRKRDQAVFGGLIRATIDFARSYSDDDLCVVRGFLDGARDITAAYAHALEDREAATGQASSRSQRPKPVRRAP
jgi:DNA-binding MarR family transcriptional regulator